MYNVTCNKIVNILQWHMVNMTYQILEQLMEQWVYGLISAIKDKNFKQKILLVMLKKEMVKKNNNKTVSLNYLRSAKWLKKLLLLKF